MTSKTAKGIVRYILNNFATVVMVSYMHVVILIVIVITSGVEVVQIQIP